MQTTPGALTAVIENLLPVDEIEAQPPEQPVPSAPGLTQEGMGLRHDLRCILMEVSMDRGIFSVAPNREHIEAMADTMARRLAPRLGGRYIPKAAYPSRADRAARDAAICAAFNGRNHAQLMREFDVSRRLVYAILAAGKRQEKSCKA